MEVLPLPLIAIGFLLIMTGIVFRGIRESMWVNVVSTIIEATGLLIVITAGASYVGSVSYLEIPPEKADIGLAVVVLQASVLTFFAFIGFEDAINVGEECRDPQTTIPIGLMAATVMAAVLYIATAITSVSVVPPAELSVGNSALINYITASRLLFGMSAQGLLPEAFGAVHEKRRTPHYAILALLFILLPLALLGSIGDLASATVLLLMLVFIVVNASLFVLIRRPGEVKGKFEVPQALPLLGAGVCFGLLVTRLMSSDWVAPALAGALIAGILIIYAIYRPDAQEID